MAIITYQANNFGQHWGPKLKGTHHLYCNWPEIVWAAITVGRASTFEVLRHGVFSFYEILYRSLIVFANLMENASGKVIRTPSNVSLDPSEKGAISYLLGLMSAKLISERLLQTPWLMHTDNYLHNNSIFVGKSRSRPDLIGLDNRRRWVVIEAKGRSHAYDGAAMTQAKKQTRMIRTISGAFPNLRVAIQSYFSRDEFRINLEDPSRFDENSENFKIAVAEFISDYYRPITHYLEHGLNASMEVIGDNKYLTRKMEELDLTVGLDKSVFEILSNQSEFDPEHFVEQRLDIPIIQDNTTCVGVDGLMVKVGELWSSDNMKRFPYERHQL